MADPKPKPCSNCATWSYFSDETAGTHATVEVCGAVTVERDVIEDPRGWRCTECGTLADEETELVLRKAAEGGDTETVKPAPRMCRFCGEAFCGPVFLEVESLADPTKKYAMCLACLKLAAAGKNVAVLYDEAGRQTVDVRLDAVVCVRHNGREGI